MSYYCPIIAIGPATSAEKLHDIVVKNISYPSVCLRIVDHLNTSRETLELLSASKNSLVSQKAAKRLAKHYPAS